MLVGLWAPAAACPVPAGPDVGVVSVARTGELVLADRRVIRLAGLIWPSAQEAGARQRAWQAASRLAEGARARLSGAGRADRWGRVPALVHLSWPDGPSEPALLQSALAARGLAMVWPDGEAAGCRDVLAGAETTARMAGHGQFAPLAGRARRMVLRRKAGPGTARRFVYEGRVRAAREGRTAYFLSFAGPRATTPYVLISKRELVRWRKEGLDPATFSGKRLRVRGVLTQSSVWRLDVMGPQAVEVLE